MKVRNIFFSKRKCGISPCYIELLPNEIILQIFSFVSINDLCSCGIVNRNWYHLYREDKLWLKHCILQNLIFEEDSGFSDVRIERNMISWFDYFASYNYSRKRVYAIKQAQKQEEFKRIIEESPPYLFDYLTSQTLFYYFFFGTGIIILLSNSILSPKIEQDLTYFTNFLLIFQSFVRLSYPVDVIDTTQEYFNIGVADLALLFSLYIAGPILCNIFQVYLLKPLIIELADEPYPSHIRQQFFKDGWILGVVFFS